MKNVLKKCCGLYGSVLAKLGVTTSEGRQTYHYCYPIFVTRVDIIIILYVVIVCYFQIVLYIGLDLVYFVILFSVFCLSSPVLI